MNPFNYIDAKKMAEDAQRLKWIDRENKELLKKINIINRHGVQLFSYLFPIFVIQNYFNRVKWIHLIL